MHKSTYHTPRLQLMKLHSKNPYSFQARVQSRIINQDQKSSNSQFSLVRLFTRNKKDLTKKTQFPFASAMKQVKNPTKNYQVKKSYGKKKGVKRKRGQICRPRPLISHPFPYPPCPTAVKHIHSLFAMIHIKQFSRKKKKKTKRTSSHPFLSQALSP